jgi:ABC-type proline/glycine betaine transport system substrate-binding protein
VVLLLAAGAALARPPSTAAQTSGDDDQADLVPGSGETLVIGRPTWDTGWFQAEIIAQLLAELGYVIDGPVTYGNDDFYREVQAGTVDLWVSGWFPLHDQLLPETTSPAAERIGFEVKGGALQGYVADLATIEATGIETLADLADPDIAARFDRDGDGRADLIGCNLDWACHPVVEHHLDVYGLSATVEQISSDYGPLMQSAVNRFAQGEPMLYYTYTPNWTGGVLVPGRDVAWIPVPEPSLPVEMAGQEADTVVPGIEGCLGDPCGMGFPPNDIRAVANSRLLDQHPAIASLLDQFTIALDDISAQNALMYRGEDSSLDIEQHATDWIRTNEAMIDRWLATATQAHLDAGLELGPRPPFTDANRIEVGTIRVAARTAPPFVTFEDGTYAGFTMELLDLVAEEIGAEVEVYGVTSNAKLIDDVVRGEADVGASALAVTFQRERLIDFSQPYFDSGLEILVPTDNGGILGGRLSAVARTLFSRDLLIIVVSLIVVLVVAAHIVWLAERRTNPEFPQSYRAGIWEAFWWAAVTATTVGYGDKTPKGVAGRIFGLVWMFVGLFLLAYFTAGIASAFTIDELEGRISGPADLRGREVGVVADSLADEYLRAQGIPATEYVTGDEAYEALLNGSLDAVVHDAAILEHFVTENTEGGAEIAGLLFAERGIGFALGPDSELTEALNRGLISVIESGEYDDLHEQWFGADG